MAAPTPALPSLEDPIRDTTLWDVELHTADHQHICHASAVLLAQASPNYLWAHVRAHRSGKFDKDADAPLVVGPPGLDPAVARNLVVWSTQLRQDEQDAWLAALLPATYTSDQWRVLLQHLDAARALQLLAAGAAVRRRALRPALHTLVTRPRAILTWDDDRVGVFVTRPYILSAKQMGALPSLPAATEPWCARLHALGVDVSDDRHGLFLHRVHHPGTADTSLLPVPLGSTMPLRRGMVLTRIGNTVLDDGGGWEDKLARARAALPPLRAAAVGSTMFVRRRVELQVCYRNYTGVRWDPWPEELREVHRHLRDLQLEDELAVLAALLRRWQRQTLEDLRAVAMAEAHAHALAAAFWDMVGKDVLIAALEDVGVEQERKRRRK